ncbi:uncharacterized protein LOC142597520 [Dermatophagoides farinae]|uniref:uncharacterized protein LOC142597520 n=1 Tax=Dermatophagoides farinae TaxID=6954 RepID=UPI003F627F15
MAENEPKILTPKDKQILDQKIRSKKKQFIRFLQSNQNCLPYCTTITNEFQKELETKIEKLIANKKKEKDKKLENALEEFEDEPKKLRQLKHQLNRKAIKFPEIIFGLNETFKMIERKQISMIWLEEKSLAMNIKNIIQKLCADNQIMCLIFELKNLKTLFNVSSLAIMAFKQTITVAESQFNEIYSFVRMNRMAKPIETQPDESEEKSSANIQTTIKQIIESKPFKLNTNNSNDQYGEMMKKRLFNGSRSESLNHPAKDKLEFVRNESFIAFTTTNNDDDDDDEYFLDYNNKQQSFKLEIEIIWPDQSHIEQRRQSSKNFAIQLYELDQFDENSKIEPSKTNLQFKTPKQIKGHCDESLMGGGGGGDKRKRKIDKRRKRKESIQNKKKKN